MSSDTEVMKAPKRDKGEMANKEMGYASPRVEPGRIVLHRFTRSQTPRPALVVKSVGRAISINVYDENGNYRFHDSVRHATDPDLVNPIVAGPGFWDFTDRDVKIDALLAKVFPEPEAADDLPPPKK